MADTDSANPVLCAGGDTPDDSAAIKALRQIAHIAIVHYAGGGFDPEHMRSIANAALCAINGGTFDNGLPHDWKEYPDPYHVQDLEESVKKFKKRLKRYKTKLAGAALEKHVVMLQKRHARFDQNRSTWMQKDCETCSSPMLWDVGWLNDLSTPDVDGVKCWSCGVINSLKRTLFDKLEPCTETDNIATSFEPPCPKSK